MLSAIRARLTPTSVPARLTFWYLLTLGATLAGFAVFVYLVRAHTLYRELDADLDQRAHQLAAEFRPALLSLDVATELAGSTRAAAEPFLVRETPDQLLYRSPAFPPLSWAGERQTGSAARGAVQFLTVNDQDDRPVRLVTILVDRPGAEALALQVAISTAGVRQALRQLTGMLTLIIGVVLVIAGYGSTLTARRALAPVDEIVERARRIQAQHLSERLDVRGGSQEIDRLVQTLNGMLDRIERSFHIARRFAADASHELQTPVAAMRASIDVYLRNGAPAGDFETVSRDLMGEIERLSALIRDLRLLALAEGGHLLAAPEPVDVADVAADSCEIAAAIAEDRQILVELTIDNRPRVTGSALHLRRVFLNLIGNAVRYSPTAAAVLVSVGTAGHQAIVTVRDQGCGIPADDLPHIFEPFYRADPARARDTGGTGLGLAIADQIVRAHGGQILVASTPGAGSIFEVRLPASDQA